MSNQKHIAVIGGGLAGMETAALLSDQNYKVTVIEKQQETGGKLNDWHHLFPNSSDSETVISSIKKKIAKTSANIIYNTQISHIKKQSSRFELSGNNDIKITADAIVLACGFNLFDASLKEEYGYGLFKNVITSADFERRMKKGIGLLTAQGKPPKRVGIIHCVGSRDAKSGNTYCSKVCCITGVKQAIEINKMIPECEVFNFYMDLRLYGSSFDSLYLTAQQQHKIQFIRGRLSEVSINNDESLQIKAEDTLSGKPLRMNTDMVILLVGMEPCLTKESLIENNDIQLDSNGFFKALDVHADRNSATNEGVFLAGSCLCPMSVNDTIENARSCAVSVISYFKNNA